VNSRWVGLGVLAVVVLGVVIWFARSRSGGEQQIDLLDRFSHESTIKRGPYPYSLTTVAVSGEEKRAIQTVPESRFIWKVAIPREAWLRTAFAVHPDSWTKEGDGVLFRIGISDGRRYVQLLNQHVNPIKSQGDRRWILANLDLSAYADQEVEVIFNTNTSPPPGNDRRNDVGLWGEPQIYVR
jgi:hypothetical protein